MTYVPRQQESPINLQHAPSNNPTHFPVLNRMTTEMRCPPRDHLQNHDAPPDSSLIKPPAIFHAKPCTTSSALVSQMPQPTLSLTCLPKHHKQYTGPLIGIKEYCYGIVHPVTKETITHYRKLIKDPLLKDLWISAMSKELHRLAQGCPGVTKGTNTFFTSHTLIFAKSHRTEH